jgi:hypothetical protein
MWGQYGTSVGFFSECFGLPQSALFHQSSKLISLSLTLDNLAIDSTLKCHILRNKSAKLANVTILTMIHPCCVLLEC